MPPEDKQPSAEREQTDESLRAEREKADDALGHGRVVVRLERISDELHFAVSDTGVGIPADKLEAVFERFRQLNTNDRRGIGLGLYISKCIVQGHGGTIWAESKLRGGSTFYFTLPVHLTVRT